ncbi:lactate utilization protein C [Actinomadura barringtoniae]|uniref:Lactate utilization protein C n=1 Tax=Actinomadura barringtoniae TaxID=1427535 RepID=A0A939PE99_9ACTN|nr:lactate utilization protein C [Actinomadura barringtoniae]MBO2451020.1 lactate utilization protein C [Actinomadura barringtoniae]
MSAREEILARIERVVPTRDAAEISASYDRIERAYLRHHHEDGIVDLFVERAADYRATVRQVNEADLPQAIAEVLAGWPEGRLSVPDDLPAAWLGPTPPTVDGAVSGCAVAIAETGTIVLDHGAAQGRRALSLIPDRHLVIVSAEQIAPDVPEALERLDPRRPLTFVSGPSATSDIELSRVEGVHGPRVLEVLVVLS